MQAIREIGADRIEILPVVVVTRAFPARPAAVPDIREFIRQHLAQSPLPPDEIRLLGQRVVSTLLEAAGPGGTIQVSLRIFANHAEVDVLQATQDEMIGHTETVTASPPDVGPGRLERSPAPTDRASPTPIDRAGTTPPPNGATASGPAAARAQWSGVSFADWLADALRREDLTMEAAARQLKVSVKTVSRWVRGTTEPRLCDLSRIREVFGDLHFL
jgi:hypothetical protein